jgi:hypothetical protein
MKSNKPNSNNFVLEQESYCYPQIIVYKVLAEKLTKTIKLVKKTGLKNWHTKIKHPRFPGPPGTGREVGRCICTLQW